MINIINGDVFLTVEPNGKAYITTGVGTNNIHGLQIEDLHDGKYEIPYFAYKKIHKYADKNLALTAYNEWRKRFFSNSCKN